MLSKSRPTAREPDNHNGDLSKAVYKARAQTIEKLQTRINYMKESKIIFEGLALS